MDANTGIFTSNHNFQHQKKENALTNNKLMRWNWMEVKQNTNKHLVKLFGPLTAHTEDHAFSASHSPT